MPSSNRQIAFRVNADEEAQIEAALARTTNLTVGAFAKAATLATARLATGQPLRPAPKAQPVKAQLVQCGLCGGRDGEHRDDCPRTEGGSRSCGSGCVVGPGSKLKRCVPHGLELR